ncbi:MAG: MFS transporter [Hyphomicrobiaceae bacterium]
MRAVQAFATATLPLLILALLQTGLPVLAPSLMMAAGRPAADFGLVGGAMGLGSVWLFLVNRAFVGALGALRSCRVAAIVSMAGVGLVATGDFGVMVAGAVLIGFAYAAVTPAGAEIIVAHTPPARRATVFSVRQAVVPLAGMIAGMGGIALAGSVGWRGALAAAAGLCAALALGLGVVPRDLGGPPPTGEFSLCGLLRLKDLAQPFRFIRGRPGLGRMALSCVAFATAQSAVNTFLVVFLTTSGGFSLTAAGALFATMQAVSIGGRLALGPIVDRLASPRSVLRMLAPLSAVSTFLVSSLSADWGDWQIGAVLVLAGLSVSTWNGLYLADVAAGFPNDVGEATAAVTLFVFGTFMLVPPAMTAIITLCGYRPAFLLAAVVVGVVPVVLLRPRGAAV